VSGKFTESVVEDAALEWLGEIGCAVLHGPEIAPGELAAERGGLRRDGAGRAVAGGTERTQPHSPE
jgi:hypothetical protein